MEHVRSKRVIFGCLGRGQDGVGAIIPRSAQRMYQRHRRSLPVDPGHSGEPAGRGVRADGAALRHPAPARQAGPVWG